MIAFLGAAFSSKVDRVATYSAAEVVVADFDSRTRRSAVDSISFMVQNCVLASITKSRVVRNSIL